MTTRKFKNVQGLELFQLAAKATENKDLPLALEYFDEIVIRTGGKSALPLLSRATCYTELKQFDKCVEDCQKILKLPSIPIQEDLVKGSTTSHSAAYSRLNNAYKELNLTEKAGEALKKRADLENAARKEAYERNKKIIQTEGEKPKIQEIIEDEDEDEDEADKKFNEELNSKIKEFKTRGKDLFLQKRYEDASKVYKIALQLDEDDHILHGNLSGCYIQLEKFDDALYHANECVRINGNWAKGYYRQGCSLMGKKEFKLAYDCFSIANKLEPKDKLILKELERAKKLSPGLIDKFKENLDSIMGVIVVILACLYFTGALNDFMPKF